MPTEPTMKIYKYPIADIVTMPIGSIILHVRYQVSPFGHGPMLWALVNPEEKHTTPRRILTLTTGEDVPYDVEYLGSYEDPIGLMFHIFEV